MCSGIVSGNANTVCRMNVVWMNTRLADRRGLHYASSRGEGAKMMRNPRIGIEEYAAIIRNL